MFSKGSTRRSFLKNGTVAGAATVGAGLLAGKEFAFGQEDGDAPTITKGDIAILTFLSALEQVEADLWIQYAELGGPTTDHRFLNNYLASKGAKPIDLSSFAILPPSQVTGVPQKGRLTNLKQLTVDTSWWTRYRSATANPDLGGTFEQAVPGLAKGQHPAIPLNDNDLVLNPDGTIPNHLQAIANTAGFHFGFIEQGGTSLYPTLAQKVTNLEVLRVLLSIGPSETMHFQVWHDKAGNAPAITDGNLTFPNLNSGVDPNNGDTGAAVADEFQTNLIMPEPTIFLNSKFGPVSIIRPTAEPAGGATAAVQSFVADGLFLDPATGKNTGIVGVLMSLAEDADEARRQL